MKIAVIVVLILVVFASIVVVRRMSTKKQEMDLNLDLEEPRDEGNELTDVDIPEQDGETTTSPEQTEDFGDLLDDLDLDSEVTEDDLTDVDIVES